MFKIIPEASSLFIVKSYFFNSYFCDIRSLDPSFAIWCFLIISLCKNLTVCLVSADHFRYNMYHLQSLVAPIENLDVFERKLLDTILGEFMSFPKLDERRSYQGRLI